MSGERVLVVDDDPLSREFLEEALRALDLVVEGASDGEKGIARLWQGGYDMVVTDLKMPGADGLDVLAAARQMEPPIPVVLITAHGTVEVAVAAMRDGADDFLIKPASPEQVEMVVRRFREKQRLAAENRYLRDELGSEDHVVAVSPGMKQVMALADRVASSKATVLITGESGVGKEVVASYIHRLSPRKTNPFVRLNCAALSESLLESELFGHEKGAFTGANGRREGRFELADKGTLLLDEVAETGMSLQTKLLRVLESEEFERVGGTRTNKVDVRVIAATNRDLEKEVAEERFRRDLYFRLNVFPIEIPPLRDRIEDIPLLIQASLQYYKNRDGRNLTGVHQEAMAALTAYHWPGNVRELLNVMQRVVLLAETEMLTPDLVSQVLGGGGFIIPRPTDGAGDPIGNLVGRKAGEVEKDLILATLDRCQGNRRRAAELLGLTDRTLRNKLGKWRDAPTPTPTPIS